MATHEPLIPGFPIAVSESAITHAREVAARENLRGNASSPWNGRIETPALTDWLSATYGESYVWSATQLEKAAKCQWNWFAERLLHLDPRADADEEMEPTVRGTIVHDTLRRFFAAATLRMKGPAFLRIADGAWARPLMASSVTDAWKAAADAGEWLGPPSLQAVARNEIATELQKYLDFEIDWNEKSFKGNTTASKQLRMGAVEGEFAFKNVRLTGAGIHFLLRGSIDRIDRGLDERIHDAPAYIAAIDYKSTIYSTPASGKPAGWDDGVVLQVPLYAAALRALRPDDLVARMEYRAIRNPKPVHSLVLAPVKKGEILDAPDAEDKLTKALESAARVIGLTRAGEFPTAPTASCGCSPYCPARDICRIPGGPVETGW